LPAWGPRTVGLALLHIVAGVEAFNSPTGWRDGAPFQMLFFFASIMTLAAIGDARVLRSGMPHGRPRLARRSSSALEVGNREPRPPGSSLMN
jgi:hypothetical protein